MKVSSKIFYIRFMEIYFWLHRMEKEQNRTRTQNGKA